MALSRISAPLLAVIAAILASVSSGCGWVGPSSEPTVVTTCALRDGGSKYDGLQVAVQATIRTDLKHYQNIESAGCTHLPVAMYFAVGSRFDPCGDNEFAKSLQCPLNAADWRIEATFIGTYRSADRMLEVISLKGFKRTEMYPKS